MVNLKFLHFNHFENGKYSIAPKSKEFKENYLFRYSNS